jgi:long-subunit fatty acid transport protein
MFSMRAEAFADGPATSFAFHNPAGMTRLEGHSLSLGAGLIVGETEFDPDPATPFPGGDGGNQAGLAPLAGIHGTFSMTDDLKVGMSVTEVRLEQKFRVR